jgi:hypothetical protein
MMIMDGIQGVLHHCRCRIAFHAIDSSVITKCNSMFFISKSGCFLNERDRYFFTVSVDRDDHEEVDEDDWIADVGCCMDALTCCNSVIICW